MKRHSAFVMALLGASLLVGSASAQAIVEKPSISSAGAKQMGEACEAYAKAHGWHVTVWVLDEAGMSLYMHRMQGAPWLSVEPSRMKAQTALQTGRPNSTYAERAAARGPIAGPNVGILLKNFMAGGGIPVIVNGQTAGAIGVGGSRAPGGDPKCAQVGVDAIMKK